MIDPDIIMNFERETGVKVFLNYYESNEELLAKLQFSGGAGYDLIIPSHYVVKPLIKRGFLKKIDKKSLGFWSQIDPHLLGHYYDPEDEYSIPYMWDVYGLGINRQFFADKKINKSWQMVFDPSYKYRVGMTNDIREVMDIASLYLYGRMEKLQPVQLQKVKDLLLGQKKFVEAYTDLIFDFLLTSKICPVVFMPSTALYRARRNVDWVDFILPDEGSIFNIDSFVISAKSSKDDMIYTFLNYIYKKDVIRKAYDFYGYLPPRKDLLHELNLDYLGGIDFVFGPYFEKLQLSRALVSRKQMTNLWLAIKAY
jgi:spermidine/putrescine transport system substrate-binding protein